MRVTHDHLSVEHDPEDVSFTLVAWSIDGDPLVIAKGLSHIEAADLRARLAATIETWVA